MSKLIYKPFQLYKSDINDLVEEDLEKGWKVTTKNGERFYASGPHVGKKVGSIRGKGGGRIVAGLALPDKKDKASDRKSLEDKADKVTGNSMQSWDQYSDNELKEIISENSSKPVKKESSTANKKNLENQYSRLIKERSEVKANKLINEKTKEKHLKEIRSDMDRINKELDSMEAKTSENNSPKDKPTDMKALSKQIVPGKRPKVGSTYFSLPSEKGTDQYKKRLEQLGYKYLGSKLEGKEMLNYYKNAAGQTLAHYKTMNGEVFVPDREMPKEDRAERMVESHIEKK